MVQKIKVRKFDGGGFSRVYDNERFTVALKNAASENSKGAVKCLERHNETDEIFILLEGRAWMMEAEVADGNITELIEIPMKQHVLYVIPQGVWHNTWMEDGAKFAIIENVETSYDNTDVIQFKK